MDKIYEIVFNIPQEYRRYLDLEESRELNIKYSNNTATIEELYVILFNFYRALNHQGRDWHKHERTISLVNKILEKS